MNYLKDFNLTDEQIKSITETIIESNVDINIFKYDSDKVIEILNLFLQIGVTNLYNIIITRPALFCDTVESIKKKIDKYEDKVELANLLNEDALNLELIGLL